MAELSNRAQRLLARVKAGHWYRPFNPNTPKAMQELVAAGLVSTTGRVVVIELAYVPADGYTPFVPEKFRGSAG